MDLHEARDGLGGQLDNGRVRHRRARRVVRTRKLGRPLSGQAVVPEVEGNKKLKSKKTF